MLVLEYEIDASDAQAFFDYAGYHTRNMTPLMSSVADLVHDYVEVQFDTEGEVMSGGWAQLSEPTQDYRENRGFPPDHPILDMTGDFRADVTRKPAKGGEFGGGLRYGDGWVTFNPEHAGEGGDVDLVEAHNYGRAATFDPVSQRMSGGMPPRPIWETPATMDEQLEGIAYLWLRELKRLNRNRRGRVLERPEFDFSPTYDWQG